jgi:hypothetical protein
MLGQRPKFNRYLDWAERIARRERSALGWPGHGEDLFACDRHVVRFATVLLDQRYQRLFIAPRLEAAVTPNH